jgi:glycosyltransferase involved in cell wall biosynthesis
MKILFVSIEYPPETPDGIGSYVAEIGPALVERGHEVHVLSCLPGQSARDCVDRGVHVHRRSESGFTTARAPKATERLRHALACRLEAGRLGVAFDVVEAPDWMAEGLGFAFCRPAPLVVHLHTPLAVTSRFAGTPTSRDLRLAAWLERAAARRADLLTAPSRRLLDLVAPTGWLEGKAVRLVRLPIAARDAEPESAAGRAAPTVLCVGRLEPLKAPDLLVEAAARLRRDVDSAEVVFVGRSAARRDGKPYGEWLEAYARDLGAPVRLVDEVPRAELERWYRGARVVAVPSRHENLPYAALEALAYGRPVVCRASSGLAELLLEAGAGAVVREEGPDAFAAALRPFLEQPELAAAAGARARELVERHCSPAAVAAQREACYSDAIALRRRRR